MSLSRCACKGMAKRSFLDALFIRPLVYGFAFAGSGSKHVICLSCDLEGIYKVNYRVTLAFRFLRRWTS
jgi:hypothetical protein